MHVCSEKTCRPSRKRIWVADYWRRNSLLLEGQRSVGPAREDGGSYCKPGFPASALLTPEAGQFSVVGAGLCMAEHSVASQASRYHCQQHPASVPRGANLPCGSQAWTESGRRWIPNVLMGGSRGEDLLMNRMWVGKERIKKDFILTKQEHLKNSSYVSLLLENYPLSSSSSSLTPHWTVQMELAADQGPPSAVRS